VYLESDARLLLALTTSDYPATPGDVYNLTYFSSLSGTVVSAPLALGADYQLKVQNLGTLNARNKTYVQLKAEVESLVSRNYPLSGPNVTMIRLGHFYVMVTGETASPGNRNVDGLTRVSSLVGDPTGKASIRFVDVVSGNGNIRTYDRFIAARTGNLALNPYIRPGEQISIPPAGRVVQIQGEVFRSGRYELLPNEQLAELVENYGGGFTKTAAPERMSVVRLNPALKESRDRLDISWYDSPAFQLVDGDIVSVDGRDTNRQAVFFEGAVFFISDNETLTRDRDETTRAVARIPYYFYPGETLSRASRGIRQYFTEVSDLATAYILRNGNQLPVNLEKYLYLNDYTADVILEGGDVIVVPYRQFYTIRGEVIDAGNKSLNVLTRLSSLMTNLTPKATKRLVTVTSIATGESRVYDLFLARRFGELSQNPYIRPGDVIHVPAAERTVTLTGQVNRPGEYELLPGESLKELIEYYGDGFTLAADPEKITLSRIDTPEGVAGESKLFSYKEGSAPIPADQDVFTVGNKIYNRPLVYIEGAISAVNTGNSIETSAAIEGTTKVEFPFYAGQTLGMVVRSLHLRFTPSSDLTHAYILRQEKNIPVDLNQFLHLNDFSDDMMLENNDRIIIPFIQYFVLVSGAVKAPGRYPYIPDRLPEYYINLAGGRDPNQNNGRGDKVYDMHNNNLSTEAFIQPESIIIVPSNRFAYYFNQYVRIITTILSIAATTISILAVTGSF
jgi:protein involved in polysaccharide export with SLBB domain